MCVEEELEYYKLVLKTLLHSPYNFKNTVLKDVVSSNFCWFT